MSGKKGYFIGMFSGMFIVVALLVLVNFLSPGFMGLALNGNLNPSSEQSRAIGVIQNLSKTSTAKTSADVTKKINDIYKILDSSYVGDYDKQQTVEAMYQGLVYGVGDPYTTYMNKDNFDDFMQDTEGSFAGIGVVVSVDESDNKIVVVSPFEGCPGALAGILPKDKILKVNGYDVYGDTLHEAVALMKGVPGTSVTVTIYRESTKETFDLDIIRDNIEVPTVTHKMVSPEIGYIRITQFTRVTKEQYFAALSDLKAQRMKGLIIDLRNNPGGLLDVVCDITDSLVPEGTIVYTEDKNGKRDYTKSDKDFLNLPLLVLVNGNSASASEVLSGAVKDMGMGELVGTQTFGKGLVQNIFRMSDGSALKVTVAKYYTPSGVCIQGEGIPPNHKVEMDDKLSVSIANLTLEEDIQLNAAAKIMEGKVMANR